MGWIDRVRVVAIGLALAGLGGCTKPAPDTAKIADAAKDIAHQMSTAFNAKDAVKAASFDAPGYVAMFHGAPATVGPAADAAVMKQQVADPAARFDLSDDSVDVAVSGDFAVYRAKYVLTYTDPSRHKVVTEHGNWVAGLKPQPDGSLKFVWSIGADTGPGI